ncbi:MAG: hypothetical protein HWE26_07470, partial [Alteromonadaceae bacterium]|nr:hypothetical protein [Alteromonadaceae bacterium]
MSDSGQFAFAGADCSIGYKGLGAALRRCREIPSFWIAQMSAFSFVVLIARTCSESPFSALSNQLSAWRRQAKHGQLVLPAEEIGVLVCMALIVCDPAERNEPTS